MLKKLVLLFLAVFILVFLCLSQQTETKGLIAQGDEFYAQRVDLAKAKEAMAKYQEALLKGENNYEAYWKMARAEYWIGDHVPESKEKKATFLMGTYYAKKAIALEPEKPDGHYWLGVNYGMYGEARGVIKSLFLVKPIKAEMNKVVELDRAYEFGGADRVLGRVYYKLPGFAGGSNKKSLEHLLKSKEYGPNDATTRMFLAETYLALDKVEEARQELEYLIGMTSAPEDMAETQELQAQAKKMLAEKKEFRKK
jgi:tetratricopeptide (TPR) repeat protein